MKCGPEPRWIISAPNDEGLDGWRSPVLRVWDGEEPVNPFPRAGGGKASNDWNYCLRRVPEALTFAIACL